VVLMIWMAKAYKIERRELKMNTTTEKSVLGRMPSVPAISATSTTSTQNLALWLLAAGVAALVVLVDHMIDGWADTHVRASWLALWGVAVLAILALRGVTRMLAQGVITGLDNWSASVARRRSDERLWAMAQTDTRMMRDLQTAMDRAEDTSSPAADLTTLMSRRAARILKNRMHYI
jgi:hypothetical protein